MADAATLQRTGDAGDAAGLWARFQSLLPWYRGAGYGRSSEPKGDKSNRKPGRHWFRLRFTTVACISILAVGVVVRAFDPQAVEALRVKTFDLYQRLSPRPVAQYPVGIIDIDEKSLAEIGQWPWPRTTVARLLENAHKMGAAVVGFDIVFAERDRMSPAIFARSTDQLTPELRTELEKLASNEKIMADVLKRTRVVLGQVGISGDLPIGKQPAANRTPVMAIIDERRPEARESGPPPAEWVRRWVLGYKNLLGNVPELEAAAAGNGLFSVGDEFDGVIRRVPLVYSIYEKIYPALTLDMLRVAFGARTIAVKLNDAGMVSVVLQGRQKFEVPTDNRGQIWVHFSEPDKFDTPDNSGRLYISAADILSGRLPPEKIKGKLLVIGTSAVGLKDIRNTPIHGRLPGVEVHANILENIFAAQNAYNAKIDSVTKVATDEARQKFLTPLSEQQRADIGNAEDAYKKAVASYNTVAPKIAALQRSKQPIPADLADEFTAAEQRLKNAQAAYQRLAGPIEKNIAAHVQAAAKAQASETPFRSFFLRYPNIMNSIELAMMLMAGIAMMVLIPRVGPMLTLAGVVVAGAALAGVTWYLYTEHQVLVDVTYPGAVTIIIYAVLTFANYAREAAEKRQVRGAFGQYLSPALVEQLANNPDQLKLGGETKEMTFLFCDVRGFTAISEQFKSNPQGLTVLMNRLLTPLTKEILDREGTIDKYMGDCIMAFWNAPLDDANHAYHACESTLAMFEALEVLNSARKQEAEEQGITYLPLNIGIGVNTGECVVGNMGSEQRFDYSVLGDAVNLASRLEGQSKTYGVGTVIGEITYNQVGDQFAVIELDQIAVKGKKEAVTIYGLLGSPDMRNDADYQRLVDTHNRMLEAYRSQNFDEAEHLLTQCRAIPGAPEVLYDLYEERIDMYRLEPPGPEWDGVFIATSK